jgi:hypothetical protein
MFSVKYIPVTGSYIFRVRVLKTLRVYINGLILYSVRKKSVSQSSICNKGQFVL